MCEHDQIVINVTVNTSMIFYNSINIISTEKGVDSCMEQFARSFYSKTSMYAFIVVAILLLSMYVATNGFQYVKVTQMGYILATFVFFIGLTFRMGSWFARPATREMLKRSLHNMRTKKRTKRNARSIIKTLIDNIVLQKFIFKRGFYRGIQHFLIAWGCIGSFAITFGLVLGWVRFDPAAPGINTIVMFNIPVINIAADGLIANFFYNGLNYTSMMLLAGLVMAIGRRLVNKELRINQRAEFDMFPLYLLLAVTVTGLLLTVSYKFLGGWFHYEMAYIHQMTVIVLLLYFPFGKLFHVPIRPLATAVPMNYETEGMGHEVAANPCKKCGEIYSSVDQISDVNAILQAQNFDLKMSDGSRLAEYCPACRRKLRVMKQLNMENQPHNPYAPIETNTGIHIPGFSRKNAD